LKSTKFSAISKKSSFFFALLVEKVVTMSLESELVKHQQTLYESKNPTRRWLHCNRRDWIIDAIRRTAKKSNLGALEVGPGSGIYLRELAKYYEQVTASDIEDLYLEHAKILTSQHRNLAFLVDDISRSTLPDRSFDLILCSEVIEHIADSSAAIKEMHRLLKPGGTLILSTPQKNSLLEMTAKIALLPGIINLVKLVYQESIMETGHINLLTESEVLAQLGQAGFQIKQIYKSGLYFPLVAEFMGVAGLKLEKWLEKKLYGKRLDAILWTQYYIAEA